MRDQRVLRQPIDYRRMRATPRSRTILPTRPGAFPTLQRLALLVLLATAGCAKSTDPRVVPDSGTTGPRIQLDSHCISDGGFVAEAEVFRDALKARLESKRVSVVGKVVQDADLLVRVYFQFASAEIAERPGVIWDVWFAVYDRKENCLVVAYHPHGIPGIYDVVDTPFAETIRERASHSLISDSSDSEGLDAVLRSITKGKDGVYCLETPAWDTFLDEFFNRILWSDRSVVRANLGSATKRAFVRFQNVQHGMNNRVCAWLTSAGWDLSPDIEHADVIVDVGAAQKEESGEWIWWPESVDVSEFHGQLDAWYVTDASPGPCIFTHYDGIESDEYSSGVERWFERFESSGESQRLLSAMELALEGDRRSASEQSKMDGNAPIRIDDRVHFEVLATRVLELLGPPAEEDAAQLLFRKTDGDQFHLSGSFLSDGHEHLWSCISDERHLDPRSKHEAPFIRFVVDGTTIVLDGQRTGEVPGLRQ